MKLKAKHKNNYLMALVTIYAAAIKSEKNYFKDKS